MTVRERRVYTLLLALVLIAIQPYMALGNVNNIVVSESDNFYKCYKVDVTSINITIEALDSNTLLLTIKGELPDPSYIINFIGYKLDKHQRYLEIYLLSCRLDIGVTRVSKHVDKSFKINASVDEIDYVRILLNGRVVREYSIEDIMQGVSTTASTGTTPSTLPQNNTVSTSTTSGEASGVLARGDTRVVIEKTIASLVIALFIAVISWLILRYR